MPELCNSLSPSGADEEESEKRGLAAKVSKLVDSKHMFWGIGLASFLESTLVPIPLETILIPLMQSRREKLLWIALAVLIGCLLGAIFGYAIGYYLYESIGTQVVNLFSSAEEFESLRDRMNNGGFGFVFSVGVTPVPFQIAMLAAGATKFSLLTFLAASALSRGIRYFGLAILVYFFGNQAEEIYEKNKVAVGVALLALVIIFWIF
ncbi:YqaA family protein [Pelagicoccus albus]|uniref:DedA family protein n=1 Tax=Pelagicoccus albus TaxID=415222 RepID=A0A7X1B3P6_9BACT|nr:VTT domain-containing protein [Pelagicoccus albus]MBC2605066.1 DedA family protein [Pelagicoccus albus]